MGGIGVRGFLWFFSLSSLVQLCFTGGAAFYGFIISLSSSVDVERKLVKCLGKQHHVLDKNSERSIMPLFYFLLSYFFFLLSIVTPRAVVPDASVFLLVSLLCTPAATCRPPYVHWPRSSTATRPGHPMPWRPYPLAASRPTVSAP